MELLEGKTLKRRIEDRAFKTDELLDLAIQIADGLEAAHAKGIIHRDLKPANVFVTVRGQAQQVKILDFGLAKLNQPLTPGPSPLGRGWGEAPGEGAAPDTPTASLDPEHLTSPGGTLGTVAYMSPEQARGEELDARTDLFSFGAVLYEMATGRQAFYGTATAVVYEAILNRAPAPVAGVSPHLPSELDRVINRLLEKDRDLRYQSAADLRSELKRLKRDTDSGRSAAVSAAVAGASRARAEEHGQARPERSERDALATAGETPAIRRRWPLWLAASLALIAAGIAVAWLLLHRRPPQPPPELTQTRLTFNSSENPIQAAAISPDGKYLAYSDTAGIHVKLISTGDERVIPKPSGLPAGAYWGLDSWFPDGTQLLAHTAGAGTQRGIWTVSVLGQSAREVRAGPWGWDVSPDGLHIAYSPIEASGGLRELWVMSNQGENAQKVFTLGEHGFLHEVHWSPDGQRLVYMRGQITPQGYERSIEACDLKGANRTAVVADKVDIGVTLVDFCWLADDRIVYSQQESRGSSEANLWEIGIDAHWGAPTGKPKRITRWPGSLAGWLSASADGKRLTVTKETYQAQVYLGELAAGGTRMNPPRRLTNDEANDFPCAWTADSRGVLFVSDRNGTPGIFKDGITQDTAESVVSGPQDAGCPRISADGAWMMYPEYPKTIGPSTPVPLMRIPANGGVPEHVLDMVYGGDIRCSIAPASLCVLVEPSQDEKQLTLTALDPVKGRGKVLRTIQTNGSAGAPGEVLSPDGTTFAFVQGGEAEIHIRLLSLSGSSDREITVKGWPNLTGLDWSLDGKGFYAGSVSPQLRTLLYVDLKGNARVLWQFNGAGGGIWGFPSPDGRYLAILDTATNSNVWMLEGF
ncbi:MAG TPA: protein kinase [Terriglobia bacterium]